MSTEYIGPFSAHDIREAAGQLSLDPAMLMFWVRYSGSIIARSPGADPVARLISAYLSDGA